MIIIIMGQTLTTPDNVSSIGNLNLFIGSEPMLYYNSGGNNFSINLKTDENTIKNTLLHLNTGSTLTCLSGVIFSI